MRRWWCLGALACAISLRGEAPEFKSIHPIGAARGTTNVYTLSGKFNPWPPKFWSEPPGLAFKTDTNKSKVTIEIPGDALPGARLIWTYNDEGVSEPNFFVVGAGPEVDEKEPNNRPSDAQPATLPSTFNARLDKNDDVDCYRIDLKKGQWLDASLEAYTLMSKIDGVLRLVTTNGATLDWNHDYETFDPHLWWRAEKDQTVIVQVFGFAYPATSEIRLSGGDEAFYRLHLESKEPPDLNVTGSISEPGEEDRYPLAGKKDQYVEVEVEAARIGSRLDAWLKIVDAAGNQLTRQDDSEGSSDPRVEWKCPADTNYFIVVGSTLNRGGSNYFYRLKSDFAAPDFRANYASPSLVVTNGSTNTVKINFKRLREHTNEVSAEFRGLPEGMPGVTTNLPAKSGEVSFSIVVATNAPPFQGPIRLALIDAQTKREKFALVELTTRGENNGVPNGYSKLAIESYDWMWLTIKTQAVNEAVTNTAAK